MTNLTGKRIFIVEDDVVNMAVFATVLKQSGATVVQDPWNSQTIHLILRQMPVDIILLDLMLRHGVSGYEIYDQLRLTPELAEIPVVAVSASDPVAGIQKAREKGFAGFISKPIRLNEFADQIADILNGEELWLAV